MKKEWSTALDFTFHNVSINTAETIRIEIPVNSLHSIMFLLIPGMTDQQWKQYKALHSIMFLLILVEVTHMSPSSYFTFHNVSINTGDNTYHRADGKALHSIMFLLILLYRRFRLPLRN